MEMEKGLITAAVDGIVIFAGFLIYKYVPADWAKAVVALIGSFQPLVLYLTFKWLGVTLLIRAGLMK